jgi:hypothetical protein
MMTCTIVNVAMDIPSTMTKPPYCNNDAIVGLRPVIVKAPSRISVGPPPIAENHRYSTTQYLPPAA